MIIPRPRKMPVSQQPSPGGLFAGVQPRCSRMARFVVFGRSACMYELNEAVPRDRCVTELAPDRDDIDMNLMREGVCRDI